MAVVPAAFAWASNGELIADVAKLGYIQGKVLDPAFGRGTFWKEWRPDYLVASDLTPPDPRIERNDFTDLPFLSQTFDTVVYDPPYKLNGTPSEPDARYGVHEVRTWQERQELMWRGFEECRRVLKPGGCLLAKGQDQVCSAAMRWQSDWYTTWADTAGMEKVDIFYLLGKTRKQPERTKKCPDCKGDYERVATPAEVDAGCELGVAFCKTCVEGRVPSVQKHAHGKPSFLLVFRKP